MGTFQKATKRQSRLRLALIGPSGSGKTYSALAIAKHLGSRVAVIDTERGSASKYSDVFAFDVLEPTSFDPRRYIEAIEDAAREGYDVLVIDSLSHAWMGKDGALQMVDDAARRSQSKNSYTAWRDVTPLHNALVDAILQSPCHIITTMRAKTEYVMEQNSKGRMEPRKVGMAPVQRDGMEYEFDVVGDLDLDHNLIVSKTRCPAIDGKVFAKPGRDIAETLRTWLSDGAPEAKPETDADRFRRELETDPLGTGDPPSPRKPNTPQLKAMFAHATEIGWSPDALKHLLATRYGVESSKDLTLDDLRSVTEAIDDPTMLPEIEREMERDAVRDESKAA